MDNQQRLKQLFAAVPRGQGVGELTDAELEMVRTAEQQLSTLDLVTVTALQHFSTQELIDGGLSMGVAALLKRAFPGPHPTTTGQAAAHRGLGSNTFNRRMDDFDGFEVNLSAQVQELSDKLEAVHKELKEVQQESFGLSGGHLKTH